LISEHSNNGVIPEIPGGLLVKMFIHKAEEQALGIDQNATEKDRRVIKSLTVMGLQLLLREADQRQCPPIYLISMTRIGPNMQVY
jgi:hypothetical protein